MNYRKNRGLILVLEEVTESIKIKLWGKEFQSLVVLIKKELKYDTVLTRGWTKHLVWWFLKLKLLLIV